MTRIAIVNKLKCKGGIECPYICMKYCPVNRTDKECIVKTEDSKIEIDESLCIGCNICVKRCPFEAITIINLPSELKQEPIHRYGPNQFALFNLPVPVFGKVVGLIGRNGIGKSTTLNILAGLLNPNFGDYNKKDFSYDDLINKFRGTEAQNFFEKARDGKIKISYKPQQVDLLPQQFKGTVRELLTEVNEIDKIDEYSELLEISKVMDSTLTQISGGELQRVAICATVLKKANVYFFDEPSSFLDIEQRIKISKFIRSLADENTAVMVVEHDLIILDFLADLVNIVYGKQGVFGVVSLPKTTKQGINIYLSGFMKEENMRFRDKEIVFEKRPPTKNSRVNILTKWNSFEKQLGQFHLKVKNGELFKNEVVGIFGRNGIGKTSFVKILANVIECDCELEGDIKVSFKPQYIQTNSEKQVSEILTEVIVKYDVQLVRPLELKQLFDKRLKDLSGGELQRVAIAVALSKDADLFLMDEPSAYLDVEQRLVVSKVIKDMMEMRGTTALVVDHDLLFVDYLSERLFVFEGEPARKGYCKEPMGMQEGMNNLLDMLDITLRRDDHCGRPRINKNDSVLDREQKQNGKRYYGV